MVENVKWPHEMVLTSKGQAQVYLDMSMALLSNGYLAIMVEESVAIKEYMLSYPPELFEDTEFYGWKTVREYHAAWLQLLEQGLAARVLMSRRLSFIDSWSGARQP